jgi:hypothetical protein
MKGKIIIGVMLSLAGAPAYANDCPSGICAVEINCTTGQITYTDAVPTVQTPAPVAPVVVEPTHTINVQTTNASWGVSGTPEQITQAVQTLAPTPLVIDPCLNGGCTKIEVNSTSGITTVLPLSEADLKQRAKDQVEKNQRQAELAKNAYQALPNITVWQPYDPLNTDTITATLLDKTINPDWWADWQTALDLFFKNWFWWWAL